MPRALYSDDRAYAARKEAELLEKRRLGGTYLELGPSGGVIYSEWTCRFCLDTIRNTHATGKVTSHELACPDRPHQDQVRLDEVAG